MAADHNEEQPGIPGVDFLVTLEQLNDMEINQALKGIEKIECFCVLSCLENLEPERPEEQKPAIRLLAGITSYRLDPGDQTEPFKPLYSGWKGRRSLVPMDLRDQQIDIIAKFAPTVDHIGLKARLCDVCWFVQRRRQDMAESAMTAYCDSVEAVRAGHAIFLSKDCSAWGARAKIILVRAACISRATKWKLTASKRVKRLIVDLVAIAHKESRHDDFTRIAGVSLDHELTPVATIAEMAADLANQEQAKNDPDMRLRLCELIARAYRLDHNRNEENRWMCMAAECYVQKADLVVDAPMSEAAFLQEAIQTLRNYHGTRQRRDELSARLRKAQQRIPGEMQQFSTRIDLRKEAQSAISSVRGRSWQSAFRSLILCDLPPDPEEVKETTLSILKQSPLLSMMPRRIHDHQGRLVFHSSGMNGDNNAQEENLRHLMDSFNRAIFRNVRVTGAIIPIRKTIASEHTVSHEAIQELIQGSPFIPPGHEDIYARAILHFLNGHDIESVSLLVPQLENSLYYILELTGHDTTTSNEKGIQTEASLSILLNPKNSWRNILEEKIGSHYIHEIDLLFNFPGGQSIRNSIAHGKMPADDFRDHNAIYAAWLIIHLAVVPLLVDQSKDQK